MRIVIIDPGLVQSTGHHRAVDTLLISAARARGLDVLVLGHKQLPPTPLPFPVQRCISTAPYSVGVQHELSSAALFVNLNDEIEGNLREAMPPEAVQPGDVFVVHTAVIEHLVGFFRWFRALGRKDVSFRLILRFPPGFPRTQHALLEKELGRFALTLWGGLDADYRFYSDLDALSIYYNDLSGLPFSTTPIAIDFADCEIPPRPSRRSGALTWVFAGDARWEKGLSLVPAAFARHLERHPEDRLRVQMHQVDPNVRQQLELFGPRVEMIEGTLHGADYFNHLASGDVVLVPYHPGRYWMRTSHILLEALGMGRAVVTSPGTWMEEELQSLSLPVGAIMRGWSPVGLEHAMEAISANAETILDNAHEIARHVRQRHNAGALLETLLS